MAVVDLRSDTVTKPSVAMRQAMAEAEVGDDVYGEDPTVNRLEEQVAQLLEKPSALFMPSGTMANQVAMLSHTERGDEVFIHREAHAYFYEGGAPALWAGVTLTLLEGTEGLFDSDTLAAALRPENIHHPRPRLVWLENTHNRAGGAAFGPELTGPVMEFAHRRGLVVHVDGARLFNAAVALNVPASRLVHDADSVSVCLSKGLGAPVGSLLVGPTDFIARARRYRKWLGGGMRQAGVLAAAGLVALTQIDRLAEDHERARRLAEGLRDLGYRAWQPSVPTNMVMVDVDEDAGVLAERCRAFGVLVSPVGAHRIRLVTHLDIDDGAISRALDVFHEMQG